MEIMLKCERCKQDISLNDWDDIFEVCKWCAADISWEMEEERDRVYD